MGYFDDNKCFECGITEEIQYHHVVPTSRGGAKTVPLCENCHRLAHHRRGEGSMRHSQLVKEGIRKNRNPGVPWGNQNLNGDKGRRTNAHKASAHNSKVYYTVVYLLAEEGKTLKSIVPKLADMDIKTRRGQPYTYDNLRRVMKSYKKTLDD